MKLLGGRPGVMTHPRVSHAIEGLTQGLLHRARLWVLQVPGQLLHVACSRRWLPAGRKSTSDVSMCACCWALRIWGSLGSTQGAGEAVSCRCPIRILKGSCREACDEGGAGQACAWGQLAPGCTAWSACAEPPWYLCCMADPMKFLFHRGAARAAYFQVHTAAADLPHICICMHVGALLMSDPLVLMPETPMSVTCSPLPIEAGRIPILTAMQPASIGPNTGVRPYQHSTASEHKHHRAEAIDRRCTTAAGPRQPVWVLHSCAVSQASPHLAACWR